METMSGFMLLTFWLCAGVNYIMLRNMSKRQKGLLLGVCPRRQTPCPRCRPLQNNIERGWAPSVWSAPRSVCRWPLCRRPPSR